MTEPIFKAPLPPENAGFTPPPADKEQPKQNLPQNAKEKIMPYLWYVLGGTFFIGLIFGIALAGGEDSAPATQECALRWVRNPDIQKKVSLCGRTSRTSECILYIMNTDTYDHYAEDFFRDAARLTERPEINISVENAVYSKLPIHPGEFAQIKIPSSR